MKTIQLRTGDARVADAEHAKAQLRTILIEHHGYTPDDADRYIWESEIEQAVGYTYSETANIEWTWAV